MVERGLRMVSLSVAGGGVVLPPGVRPLEITDPAEIGGHQLVGRLGSGGMGVVYLGNDRKGSLAAIKAAHNETTDEKLRRRLRAEAACVRRVPSAYTARLLADGTEQTPPFIVTEYVEGRSLEDIIENDGPLPPEQLRALATGVARALAAIHHAGLIHRDLKPTNVLLPPSGPRVIDFGIAQEIPAFGGATSDGMVMGSPGWISPERLTRSPATPAADIFGWGCLIAYAGTGRNPFGQDDPEDVAQRTIHEPPDLDGLESSLRPQVQAALAKDPTERPAARELPAWLSLQDPAAAEDSVAPEDPVVPDGLVAADRELRRGRHSRRASATRRRARRVTAFTAGSAALAVAATLTAMLVAHTGWPVWRKPGAAAAPPAHAATPHRSAVPQPRGAHSASAPRMPPATPRPYPPGQTPGNTTTHDGEQRTAAGQGLTGTTGRTVTRATTAPPTTLIDNLLPPK
ncbi:MAG: hypothetical protein JWP48_7466 [Actinoallomurus sp.]|nr:hypothetical protein [Actinoallomurus sp.]